MSHTKSPAQHLVDILEERGLDGAQCTAIAANPEIAHAMLRTARKRIAQLPTVKIFPTWKTLHIGAYGTVGELIVAMEQKGIYFEGAWDMLKGMRVRRDPTDLELVLASWNQLGCSRNKYGDKPALLARAARFGLVPVPWVVGPMIALQDWEIDRLIVTQVQDGDQGAFFDVCTEKREFMCPTRHLKRWQHNVQWPDLSTPFVFTREPRASG